MTFFPRLPVVEDGQTLSATTLNLYTRAVQHLLGQGHSSYSGQRSRDNSTYNNYFTQVWDAWGYMWEKRVFIRADVGSDTAAGYEVHLQYYGDDLNWHSFWSSVGAANYLTNHVGEVVDLSGEVHMTKGRWYHFRAVARITGTQGTYYAHFRPWSVAVIPFDFWGDWIGNPWFTEATVSSAADFNTIRHNAYVLYNWLPKYHVFSRSKELTNPMAHNTWVGITQFSIMKRPGNILLGLQLKAGPIAPHQWRVVAQNAAGASWTLYTSPVLPATIEYELRWAEVSMDELTGSTGDWFRLTFENRVDSSTWNVHAQRCYAYYESDLEVGGDWPNLEDWTHGDTDVGQDKLLPLSQALNSLALGDEVLFSFTPIAGGLMWVSGDSVDFVGPHRHRWLIYYTDGSEDRPAVHYGPNYMFSHDLPSEPLDTMMSYDMANIERLRPGMGISVSGVQFAAESDRVIT